MTEIGYGVALCEALNSDEVKGRILAQVRARDLDSIECECCFADVENPILRITSDCGVWEFPFEVDIDQQLH